MRLTRIRQRMGRKHRLGEHTEQGCLAYLGQADDARFHEISFQPSALSVQRSGEEIANTTE
jgi:hypothetical protein